MINLLAGGTLSQLSAQHTEAFERLFRIFPEELDNATGHDI